MKLWKHSSLDAVLLILSVGHFVTTLGLAAYWPRSSPIGWISGFALYVFMTVYNIVVISHLFTHTPWFTSRVLNGLASMLNSVNIGQSVQAYQLTHVRNHHRYNNDQKGPDGKTNDTSSTFRDGKGGDHVGLFRYAFGGAASTLLNVGRQLFSVFTLWSGTDLGAFLSKDPGKRAGELRQLRLDQAAHFLGICLFLSISWRWTLAFYLPGFYLSLALVNVQNYYEHYGALPGHTYANSVSYYGRLYNLLTFNDGYHQEHHLRAQAHWQSMPIVRQTYQAKLDEIERIVSPVPAIVGFLDRGRAQLHRRPHAPPTETPQLVGRDLDSIIPNVPA